MQALGILLLSAGTLLLEVGLTRFFSLAQWYHFAFWSVSIALLGFGASGSFLSAFPRLADRTHLWLASLLFSAGTLGGYLISNLLPFDAYLVAWDNRQWLYLAINYLGLTSAFFGSGLGVGILLAKEPGRANTIYGCNLVGSGVGALAAVAILTTSGTVGTMLVAAALGAAAAACFALAANRNGRRRPRPTAVAGLTALGVIVLLVARPSFLEVQFSPYKGLSHALRQPSAAIVWSAENAVSRVDVVRGAAFHSAPGLSLAYRGASPIGDALAVDGEDLSPIPQIRPEEAEFTSHLLTALPYALQPIRRALLIEPGGGLDVLTALHHRVPEVTVAYANPEIPRAVRSLSRLLDEEEVQVVVDSPRSLLRRSSEEYDLVQSSLSEGFRAVAAGAHSLSEDYLHTTEALRDAYRRVSPGGFLVMSRWLQVPPSEDLRAFSLLVEAVEGQGHDPAATLVALRSLQAVVMMAKRGPWTESELAAVRGFAEERQFDLVYCPGIRVEETNRHSIFPKDRHFETFRAALKPDSRAAIYRDHLYDVRPPNDDRPFFFHFFRWQQTIELLQQYGRSWQPFGGGGYLVTVGALLLASVASLALIVGPLAVLRRSVSPAAASLPPARRFGLWRLGLCFLCLGIGYLFLEIPLLQKFILLLGQPTYSFALVLAVLLMASGLGSLASRRAWPVSSAGREGARLIRTSTLTNSQYGALLALPLLALIYPWVLATTIDGALGLPIYARVLTSVALLLPLGFLMGMPFPLAVRLAGEATPAAIPWLWAVNGCASVVSAILAPMLALAPHVSLAPGLTLGGGFSFVIVAGALAYTVAVAILLSLLSAFRSEARTPHRPDCG